MRVHEHLVTVPLSDPIAISLVLIVSLAHNLIFSSTKRLALPVAAWQNFSPKNLAPKILPLWGMSAVPLFFTPDILS